MMRVVILLWILSFGMGFALPGIVKAQTAPQDTVILNTKGVYRSLEKETTEEDSLAEELVLDVIYIMGNVEKPGVIIVPKRVEPELPEVELDRSFKREVKEGIGDIPKLEEELGKVERVQSIKKTIGRKRK